MKYKTTISEETTLFEALSKAAPISSGGVKKLIKSREAKINGVRVGENVPLRVGDELEAFIPASFLGEAPSVVYEDENVLIAYKPILTEVVPTLTEMLKGERKFFEPMHRLDRNTTGLVVFALNQEAYDELFSAFKARKIEKTYLARVSGVGLKGGEYTAYIYKDAASSTSKVSDKPGEGYKKIITRFTVLKEEEETSVVEIGLITGRTHQIRAHLKHLSHPILGDEKYGDASLNKKFKQKYQQLCAYKLKFHGLYGKLSYLNEKVFEVKANFID